jgi:class 3 adenylate cyclase
MQCPRCGQDNAAGAKFCNACGGQLGVGCLACAHTNLPGSRFCSSCGASLPVVDPRFSTPHAYTPKHLAGHIVGSRAALEGERKQVTILFADMKSSLELIADRDLEDATHLLDAVLERMMSAVHDFEGTVNQVMGDGIMALFGAPVAHEDHALRACYAALRLLESINQYAAELRRAGRIEPRVRIGLHSGEVVVRSISSDLYMDYSAIGNTTHLAARMEQLARPGTALLTAQTFRLVEGRVEVAPQGKMQIKGLAEPVAVYELKGATRARSRLEIAAARGLTRFIGREAEMTALVEAAGRAAGGRGQVVAIVGEPGVGKSRLIWEFTRSGRLQHWVVLEGHAVPYGKESPYLPIVELLGGCFALQADDDPATIRQRVATTLGPDALARLMSPTLALVGLPVDDPQWTRLDAEQKRGRTVEAVKYVIMSSGRARPAAIVVEDLHWADAETLAVLDAVVDGVGAARLLVIVSYRPEHRHEWGGKTYYRQLPMDALAASESEVLLDELLGPRLQMAPIKQMLAGRTGGNPFFLEESVRNLVETGAIAGEQGAYRVVSLPAVTDVPATVSSVLAARIDRLPPEDKRVLQTASAIGKDVPGASALWRVPPRGAPLPGGGVHLPARAHARGRVREPPARATPRARRPHRRRPRGPTAAGRRLAALRSPGPSRGAWGAVGQGRRLQPPGRSAGTRAPRASRRHGLHRAGHRGARPSAGRRRGDRARRRPAARAPLRAAATRPVPPDLRAADRGQANGRRPE